MEVQWTSKALSGLSRLFEFLAVVNRPAAAKAVQSLTVAPVRIIEHPRIGERLDEYEPREVRRLLVGCYEMRYELNNDILYVLRIWHTREKR
ncbi:MAG TPA: type II toxin-antitoxin system RelE/ParE family toxin [Gammaproteobacteria bacterium]|nr:type II toxin-antitoxin system RelE/ParE family toxin [Gammaproteobacteria bacterium]